MQGHRPVGNGHGVLDAAIVREQGLESADICALRGDPAGLNAINDIVELVSLEEGLGSGDVMTPIVHNDIDGNPIIVDQRNQRDAIAEMHLDLVARCLGVQRDEGTVHDLKRWIIECRTCEQGTPQITIRYDPT